MTGKQIRHLRSLGHELRPLVQLGKDGITEGVLQQIFDNLLAHELIKVKLPKITGPARKEMATELAGQAEAELVQVVGRSVLLYVPHPDKPRIVLPK